MSAIRIAQTDLGEMTATELSALFASGQASPVEALTETLGRIERFDPTVNAFVHLVPEAAMAEARASEARWRAGTPLSPIDGATTTIKEMVKVRGIPFRKGSVLGQTEPATEDQGIVARLRAAGCVIVGTTTSPEFGWKGVTHSPIGGVTVNPWRTDRAAGGSSGGAAVAAALNMGVLHQGGDGAGSIRIPAAWCGVFGIKPTFGWIPAEVPSGLCEMGHLGPISRNVRDAALFMNAVAGPSVYQLYGWCPTPVPDFAQAADKTEDRVRGLRIGYARNLGSVPVDPGVAAAVGRAACRLADMGAIVEEADPGFAIPQKALLDLWYSAMYWAVEKAGPAPAQRAAMDPGLVDIVEQGRMLSARDHIEADQMRAQLRVAMHLFHAKYDVLMLPTMPLTAFEAGLDLPPGRGMTEWTDWSPFTYPFNMTEQPAVSVNCGFDAAGLPVGVQFVAPHFRDETLFMLAAAYQEAFPEPFPVAPVIRD